MTTRIRTKDDVTFHSDGFGPGRPAVNVKVYPMFPNDELARKIARDEGDEDQAEAFVRFTNERVSDEEWNGYFWDACESTWDQLSEDVTGENGWKPHGLFDQPVKVFQEGRSGGWAVVEGLPDIEDWDAVLLAKWRSFAKLARTYADDVPYQTMSIVYLNRFEPEVLDPSAAADRPVGTCAHCGGPAFRERTFGHD